MASPARPVAAILDVLGASSIRATGTAPDDGGSPITGYDWRYREVGTTAWTDRGDVTPLVQTFGSLEAATEYEFSYRAINADGNSQWSGPRLFIADDTGTDLWELDPDGADDQRGVRRDLPSGLTIPLSTTVYEGRLLVADTAGDELWELDPDGADDQGGVLRDLPSGLTTPLSMTVSEGRLLVADSSTALNFSS